jgi:hypothetical protein
MAKRNGLQKQSTGLPTNITAELDALRKSEADEVPELQKSLGLPRLTIKDECWLGEHNRVSIIDVRHNIRGYFASEYDPNVRQPPDCMSSGDGLGNGYIVLADGKRKENNGQPCRMCPMNQFGTARTGRAKACSERSFLVVHREGALADVEVVQVPIMSRNNLNTYLIRLSKTEEVSRLEVWTKVSVTKGGKGEVFTFANDGRIKDDKLMSELINSRKMVADVPIGAADLDREIEEEAIQESVSDA